MRFFFSLRVLVLLFCATLSSESWAGTYKFPNADEVTRYFTWTGTRPAATGDSTSQFLFGALDRVARVAAVLTRAFRVADSGLVAGVTYKAYTDPGCSSTVSACANGTTMRLGYDAATGWDAAWKYIIAHEFGHLINNSLFGSTAFSYSQGTATQAVCRCDHVAASSGQSHCLQSREESDAAQHEGFGHFYGTKLFNNLTQNDAKFVYYKHFMLNTAAEPPPVPANALNRYRWMELNCDPGAQTDRGVELDWLTFYYEVHTQTSQKFSMADIRDVYRKACGDTNCTASKQTPWSTHVTAVNALYGSNSAKASHWKDRGVNHGVNH